MYIHMFFTYIFTDVSTVYNHFWISSRLYNPFHYLRPHLDRFILLTCHGHKPPLTRCIPENRLTDHTKLCVIFHRT